HRRCPGRPRAARRPFLRRRGHHGSGERSQGRGPRLHHGICARQGRISELLDQGPASRRAGPADTAAPGRLLVPRPCQIRCIVRRGRERDRKSTRLNSSHVAISYAVFCLKKKKKKKIIKYKEK